MLKLYIEFNSNLSQFIQADQSSTDFAEYTDEKNSLSSVQSMDTYMRICEELRQTCKFNATTR